MATTLRQNASRRGLTTAPAHPPQKESAPKAAPRKRKHKKTMAAWQPEEMNSLYCHVMAHAEKFADVTCDGGAEAFNRELLQDSTGNDEEVQETPISIEVIDAVAKKEPGFVAGFGDKVHVEFVVALKRSSQLKTVGKRYSELEEFHAVLLSHNLVDRLQAPPFPEKQTFRDSWYKFDATDVNSDFVRNRRVALDQYLRNLFGTFPTLFHEPCAIAFFGIEEFEFEAAKEVSQQTAARAERVRKAQEANIAPIAPVPQQNDAGVIDV